MIITFTNVIGAIRNAISSVITTNLKMWLGFETSETLGREEVVNGDFATDLSSWDISGTDATHTVTYSNGSARYQSDSVTPQLNFDQTISNVEVGKIYQLSIDVTYTTGILKVSSIDSNLTALSEGLNVFNVVAATKTIRILRGANIVDALINSVSLKELTQITPDKSGNNNVGELFTGKAIEFDGSTDYVDCGDVGANKTLAFWFNPTGNITASTYPPQRLFGFNTSFFGITLGSFTGSLTGETLTIVPDSGSRTATTMNFDAGVWYRVVVSWNSTNNYYDIYVNGELKTDLSTGVHTLASWSNFTIGTIVGESMANFNGQMSNVQIYDASLTTSDVTYDYANPNKLAIDNPSTSLNVTNLKAYWAMSEGDGKLAYDSGTNLEEEEVVNGDGSSTVDWDSLFSNTTLSISNDKLRATSDNSTAYGLSQELNLNNGSTYQVVATINLDNASGGTGNLRIATNSTLTSGDTDLSQSTGTITTTFVASANTMYIGIVDTADAAGNYVEIDSISVREVTASDHGGLIYGADYVDAQPRIPQLGMQNWSKGSNLFPYSEDFTEWVISPTTSQVLLAPEEAAPYGQGDVYSIIMQSSESDAYIRYATTNATLTSSTHSVWVKQATTGSATHIRITNNNRAAWNTGTSQKIALTSSWQRLETTDAITGNRFTIIGSADASGTQDPDCLGKALIYGAQLVEGSSAGVYRFTDGAATSNSTVIANPTIPTQDIFGNAVRDRLNSFNLDGSGYAEVADADDLDFGTGAFTMESWVKADFLFQGSSINVALSLGGDTSGAGSAGIVSFSSNKLGGYVYAAVLSADSAFTQGNWYHVAITRNISGLCTLYIDSVAQTDTENAGGSVTNSNTKQIGRDTQTTRFYQNLISDVRLYDAELSATEIENNYNAGLSAHTNN